MQIMQYRARLPDKVQCKIVCSTPPPQAHPTRWSLRCKMCKLGGSAADEGGCEHVRMPIMEVLLLPSGHLWPFDPGHGLNVKGHQPGSVWITASPWPGMHRHGNTLLSIGGEMGGVLHSGCWNNVHKNTHQVEPHVFLLPLALIGFQWAHSWVELERSLAWSQQPCHCLQGPVQLQLELHKWGNLSYS